MRIHDERDAGGAGDPQTRDEGPGRGDPGWSDDPRPRRDGEWDESPYDGNRPRDGGRYDRHDRERRPRGDGHRSIFSDILGPFVEFSRAVLDILEDVPLGPSKVKELTYRAVVAWFVEKRPAVMDPVRGALLRKPHGQGWLVVQTFVDERGEPLSDRRGRPYGRKLIALALDEELGAIFDGRDLVLFE